MRKNHSPGGMRICLRVLCYSIAFIGMIGTREILTDGTGPMHRQLGTMFNNTLMASSKMALGIALMTREDGGEGTLRRRVNLMLGRAAYKVFVSASKVAIFKD